MSSSWYDRFAWIYDKGTLRDYFYSNARKSAVDMLNLQDGATVFDVFCGTGINFRLLKEKIGDNGRIIAVDGSGGMLKRAARKADHCGLEYPRIKFVKADFSTNEGIEILCNSLREERPGHILFTLGLTCLPQWRDFTSRVLEELPSGAAVSIMDVYSKRTGIGTGFINWIGAADCRRPVWEELESRCKSFEWSEYRSFRFIDLSVIVAAGIK